VCRGVTRCTSQLLQVRTDATYPAGFMDVIEIEKTAEQFRLVYDVKGRFVVHRISPEEASYKLAKVCYIRLDSSLRGAACADMQGASPVSLCILTGSSAYHVLILSKGHRACLSVTWSPVHDLPHNVSCCVCR
jgi:Ribosomal family S4e